MNEYLVTYDLNQESDRASKEATLIAALKLIDRTATKLWTTTTWLLISPMELGEVDRTIREALDRNDDLVVAKVSAMSPRGDAIRERTLKIQPPPGRIGS